MMNERIKELVDQCTEVLWRDGPYEREVFNKEKFAELLIRECMEVVENKCDNTPDDDGFHMGEFCGVLMATIEEHFGVEE